MLHAQDARCRPPGSGAVRGRAIRILRVFLVAATLCIAACGFQLRGQKQLPFETLYIPAGSPLAVDLKRNVVAASRTRLVDRPNDADAILGFTGEAREKVILSFTSGGRVREYQLRYRVGFRVTDPKGQVYIPTSEILLTRDISFSDSQVLAKETEEVLLYRDMQADMVQQILRRLAAARVPRPELD